MRSRPGRLLGPLFVAVVLAFLFSPLVVVIAFSFNAIGRMALPIEAWSVRWYAEVFSDNLVIQAMTRSAIASVVTSVIAAPIGVAAALGLLALSARWRSWAYNAMLIPIAVPGLLLAVSLAIYYRLLGVPASLWAAVAGHALIALPFVVLTMSAAVAGFRFSLLEAARDLGATRAQAFWTITFPLIRPAVIGAMLLSMAISVDEFIISFFVAGQDTTLPMLLWGRIHSRVDPSLNALATILLVATTVLALFASRRTAVAIVG